MTGRGDKGKGPGRRQCRGRLRPEEERSTYNETTSEEEEEEASGRGRGGACTVGVRGGRGGKHGDPRKWSAYCRGRYYERSTSPGFREKRATISRVSLIVEYTCIVL